MNVFEAIKQSAADLAKKSPRLVCRGPETVRTCKSVTACRDSRMSSTRSEAWSNRVTAPSKARTTRRRAAVTPLPRAELARHHSQADRTVPPPRRDGGDRRSRNAGHEHPPTRRPRAGRDRGGTPGGHRAHENARRAAASHQRCTQRGRDGISKPCFLSDSSVQHAIPKTRIGKPLSAPFAADLTKSSRRVQFAVEAKTWGLEVQEYRDSQDFYESKASNML